MSGYRTRESYGHARWRWACTAIVCIWLCVGGVLDALTIVPATFSEMVEESALIVRGRVRRVESRIAGSRRTIERLVSVEVIDALKGDATATVVFRVPGGDIGRYRRIVVGAPDFIDGDEVVVFLTGRSPVVPTPFGVLQGVYRVSTDGARRVVMPPPHGAGPIVRGDPARVPLAVGDFSRLVRSLVVRHP